MKAPAFQFYPDDFVGGVADMTQAEVGAYILLLCAQWGRGSIPTDPERAALIAKGSVSPHVMAKFPAGKNRRLESVRDKLESFKAACSAAGRKGGGNPGLRSAKGTFKGDSKGQPNSPSPSPSPTLTPNPVILASAPPPRARDPLFDALAEACGSNPKEMTTPAVRACGVALAAIRKASPNVQPSEFLERAARYRKLYRDAALTPFALCSHWAECGNGLHERSNAPSAPDPYKEPPSWRPQAIALYPDSDFADRVKGGLSWSEVSLDVRRALVNSH